MTGQQEAGAPPGRGVGLGESWVPALNLHFSRRAQGAREGTEEGSRGQLWAEGAGGEQEGAGVGQ